MKKNTQSIKELSAPTSGDSGRFKHRAGSLQSKRRDPGTGEARCQGHEPGVKLGLEHALQ